MERFPDLREAGRRLAERLGQHPVAPGTIVLALVRGGVPVAAEVAARLSLPLDVVLLRRLRVRADGSAACAVAAAGTVVVDDDVRPAPGDAEPGFDGYLADAVAELTRRNALCRGDSPPRDLAGATVLLVDNGIHTGGTVSAGLRALRKLGPARIAVAVPLCDPDSRPGVERLADEVVCLRAPSPFGHVGMWYARFEVPALEEVAGIVGEATRAT
jgi:putative phosphoribosyl transferase